jgi:hypothetical protein
LVEADGATAATDGFFTGKGDTVEAGGTAASAAGATGCGFTGADGGAAGGAKIAGSAHNSNNRQKRK